MRRTVSLTSLLLVGCGGDPTGMPGPKTWSEPTPLVGLPGETTATVTSDVLDLVYDSSGIILERTRADLSSPWQDKALDSLATLPGEGDSEPRISADGLTLRFRAVTPPQTVRGAVPQGGDQVMIAKRARRGDPWGPAVPDPDFTIIGGIGGVEIPSGLVVATEIVQYVGGGADVHVGFSKRARTADAFPAPTAPPELDLTGSEFFPSLTSDQLEVVFVSAADPNTFCGDYFACDVIMSATRATTDDAFDPPEVVTVLDVAGEEHDVTLVDDHRITFIVGGKGGSTLYTATR